MLGQIVYIDPNFGHKSQVYGCYMFFPGPNMETKRNSKSFEYLLCVKYCPW